MLSTSPTLDHQAKSEFDADVNRKDQGDDTPSDPHSTVFSAVQPAEDRPKTLVSSKSFDQSASRVRFKQKITIHTFWIIADKWLTTQFSWFPEHASRKSEQE